ncbi:MAG: BamA/TamA family outer membrane protein [Flavobacteriaceae bacterium]|jgi:outer membrane translocation and assembly module TamA|nr:BamA/TamA family outer membrane protein [Flavobacteriaceae bacterium]
MKFRLWILLFPLGLWAQEKPKPLKVFEGSHLWFSAVYSENKINKLLDSLVTQGYYTLRLDSVQDGSKEFRAFVTKGGFYKTVSVRLDSLSQLVIKKKESFTVSNIDSLSNLIHAYYLQKGYAFNRVVADLNFNTLPAKAEVSVQLNQKRIISNLVFNGYDKIPRGFKRSLEYEFVGETYEDRHLAEISNRLTASGFLGLEKNSQVLFSPDSTSVYLYVKKRNASSFDGIIGFGSDEGGKFRLNGQVQLSLGNIFNSFERINLNWLATPDKSQNFEIKADVPYLFKSRFGTATYLNIYRQDSTYATIKLGEHIYYQYDENQKIGGEGTLENSRYALDENSGNNFTKTGLGLTYEYVEKSHQALLGNKNLLAVQGTVFRNVPENRTHLTQYQVSAQIEKLVCLAEHHYLKPRISASALLSDTLTVNELFRIGGLRTLRGFNEQSVYANAFAVGSLEYRYAPLDEMYLSLFVDTAWINNKNERISSVLWGSGLGISFLTRFGFFSINYAVGKYPDKPMDFSDSKVHIGLQASF